MSGPVKILTSKIFAGKLKISFEALRYSTTAPVIDKQLTKLVYHESEERRGIVELCMNRPEAKNALNRVFAAEILTRVRHIAEDEKVRCVLVRSLVNNVFCAGADLKERLTLTPAEVRNFVSTLRHIMSSIESIPVPVIAVLDGGAFGGGLEMALACDLRVAASNVSMGLVETKLAIIPGAGGTQRLPRLIGVSLAKELIYTGRVITAADALSYKLINHLVTQNSDHNASYVKAMEIAEETVSKGPVAVKMAKVAIDKGVQVNQEMGLLLEGFCYDRVIATQDRIEGLKSFVGKYKPSYKGE